MTKTKKRCHWLNSEEIYIKYHDEEWGRPCHDDQVLFEFLILEGAQAGLSWITVLKKRENYRKLFKGFDPRKVARITEKEIATILKDEGIIRNRLKVKSAVTNAKLFLEIQKEFGSFDKYIWGFVGGKPIYNRIQNKKQLPSTSTESDALSKDLKKRGFKFAGSTICYAYMQACGLVNDHILDCYLYNNKGG